MKSTKPQIKSLGEIIGRLPEVFQLPYEEQQQLKTTLIVENFKYHYDNNEYYRNACDSKNISPLDIQCFDDLIKIPLIPVKRFKDQNSADLLTLSLANVEYEMRSTGTSGIPSVSRRDSETVSNAMLTIYAMYREFFKLSSGALMFLMPSTEDIPEMGMIKVLGMIGGMTDAQHYAIRDKKFDAPKALEMLEKWQGTHTRHIVGPPFLVHKFLMFLKKRNIKLKLDKNTLIINLGGWKRFTGEQISRNEYNEMCSEYFGIPSENVRDMYGLVECNSLAIECAEQSKHVSPWVHYSIRDLNDLSKEVKQGERGVLAIIDPISNSYPTFILTEDLVYLDKENTCGCSRVGQKVNYVSRVRGAEIGCCAINLEKQMDDAESKAKDQNCVLA